MWPRTVYLQEILWLLFRQGKAEQRLSEPQTEHCPKTTAWKAAKPQRQGAEVSAGPGTSGSELRGFCCGPHQHHQLQKQGHPVLERGTASLEMTQPSPSHQSASPAQHQDKGVPALTVICTSSFTQGFLSLPATHPALTGRVLVKWEVPLPSIQLHWEKPPHGNYVLHNTNLADTRTTALWASQLILLHSLPEQTM